MAGTITFSGLSTGLDTSSWVDALVSVRQTTITSLQSQQTLKKTLLSVVNSIKSYFTSFQNALQKVTDSQFGIASMDLFMQNLASSSNTSVVTASATTDAARQSYDVLVKQLATSTKATSGYTQNVTKDVTLDTTLGSIGATAGTITVNNQSFSVSTDDTIKTLIQKFSDVGVVASFDSAKSKFTVNTATSNITDGATGLKSALKLQDAAITGVSSGTLAYASASTALSKLGLTGGTINIKGSDYTITKNTSNYSIKKGSGTATTITTLGDFLNYMTSSNVGADSATVDSTGNISIKGAVIKEVTGGSNLLEALNLTEVTDRTVMQSNNLTAVNTHIATGSTTLGQLGVTSNKTLVINGTTNTLTTSNTLDNVKSLITAAGGTFSIDDKGVISMTTGSATVSGTALDALGLTATTNGTTITSSAHTVTYDTTGSTLLSDLGITNAMTYTGYKSDGTAITSSINNLAGLTVDQFITQLQGKGLNASFDSTTGKITIQDGYISGTAATQLGMANTSSMVTEIGKTTTTLAQLGATTDTNTLSINGGTATTYSKTATLQNIMTAITNAGGKATLDDTGKFTVTGVTLSGTIPTLLNLEATNQGTSITSGALSVITNTTSTGTAQTETDTNNISLSTALGNISSGGTTLVINGTTKNYTNATTLDSVRSDIVAAGGTMTINDDSTITISNVNLSGDLVTKLKLNTTGSGTIAKSNNAILVGGLQVTADSSTTLAQLGAAGDTTLTILDATGAETDKTYAKTTTIGTILTDIQNDGGTATIDENGKITVKGVNLTGTVLDTLGLTATAQSTSVTSGALTYASSASATGAKITVSSSTSPITLSSTLNDITHGGTTSVNVNDVSSFVTGSSYLISDEAGLNKLATWVNNGNSTTGMTFILNNDIAMSNTNFAGIGSLANPFCGTFDGNGHTISNLHETESSNRVGFFNYIQHGTIQNLGITSATVTNTASDSNVGILAGVIDTSIVSNCYTTGTVNGTNSTYAGGCIGNAAAGSNIYNSYSTATVNGYNAAGGFVGQLYSSTVSNCYATGNVSGSFSGNFCGVTGTSALNNCYSTGSGSTYFCNEFSGAAAYSFNNCVYTCNSLSRKTDYSGSGNAKLTLAQIQTQSVMEGYGYTTDNGWVYSGSNPTFSTSNNNIRTFTVNGTQFNLNAGSRISTLKTNIENAGGTLTVDSNGVMTISGVNLDGTNLSQYGLTANGEQGSKITGTTSISGNTTLAANGTLRVITNESNVVDLTYTAGTKYSDIIKDLNALGLNASINSDGYLTAKTYDKTFSLTGDVANALLGSASSTNFDTGYTTAARTVSSTAAATTDSTLSSMGIASGQLQIKDSSGTAVGTIDVSDSMTVSQLKSTLSSYGFTLSVNSGKFSITSSSGKTLSDGTSNALSTMGLSTWTTTNSTVATGTTMAQLGYTSGTTMSVLVDGTVTNQLSFGANDTVQTVLSALGNLGITATLSGGVFEASSMQHNFVMTGDLAATLTKGTAGYVNTDSSYTSGNLSYNTATENLATTTTVANLLKNTNGGVLRLSVNGNQIVSMNYGADATVADIINDLGDLGINATISDGKFTATSTDKTFVLSGDIGNALMGNAGTTVNQSESYLSNTLQDVTTKTATMSSTLTQLGITPGQIYIKNNNGNVLSSVDVTGDMTLNQVKASLLSSGLSMGIDGTGKVSVSSPDGYTLQDGTSDLVSKLGLTNWTTTTAKVTSATTLSQLGYKSGADLNLLIDGSSTNTLSFGATDTVGSVITALGALGITASVDTNGVFKAESTGHTFVMSGDLASTLTKGTTGYVNTDKGYQATETYQRTYQTDASPKLQYNKTLAMTTTVGAMGFTDGATLRLVEDGTTPYTLSFAATDTLQDIATTLSAYGVTTSVDSTGKVTATSLTHSFTMGGALGSYLTNGGTYNNSTTGYVSSAKTYNTTDNITTSTKLSDLGVANGFINVMKDGTVEANNIQIDDNTTVGQLFSAISPYGLTGQILTNSSGKTYIKLSATGDTSIADGTSDVVSKLGLTKIDQGDYTGNKTYWEASATSGLITGDMLLSSFDKNGQVAAGSLIFQTGSGDSAVSHIVNITSDDTVSTFLTKMKNEGVNAVLDNGVIKISNSVDGVSFTGGTSGILTTLGLTTGNLYTYSTSSNTLTYQTDETVSAANFADKNTLLSDVNVTSGNMSVYVDGVKCTVAVNSTDKFNDVFGRIVSTVAAKTGLTVKAGFVDSDGNISADTNTGIIGLSIGDGHTLVVGSSNDSTNFATIANLAQTSTTEVSGSRALYKVNSSSKITTSGLFRDGTVTAGTFKLGDATFTIDANTTLSDLINQINKSDKSYTTAYWDTLSGTMVLQSTLTGSSLINVEAGTSNFTDVMGLTKTVSGKETLNTDNQTLGNNAIVEINGTSVTSTSNTITSDVSKIKGLTLNLKGLSSGTTTTVTVGQDTDSISSAVSSIVDSYNDLMKELETDIGDSSKLGNDSMFKMIRNSLKNMITASVSGPETYKNLASIGISTGEASDSISTDVSALVLDKDKLAAALKADPDDVKKLLVGSSTAQGVFLKEYNKVSSTLKSTGYITTLTTSTNKSISDLDKKISNATDALAKYRQQLESKFSSMETIISKMQQSYSNFLGTSSSSSLSSSS